MSDTSNLNRSLSSRHLSMIAIGGSIGTGLFIASGGAIHMAGPAGALLAYFLVAIVVYFMMMSLGEMSAYMPSSGSFTQHSRKFVGPNYARAMSVNYYFNWAITITVELVAAAMTMHFWFPHSSAIMWFVIYFCLILFFNFMSVRFYGEVESFLSLLKVLAIIAFIIVGLLLLTGVIGNQHQSILHNWTDASHGFNGGYVALFLAFIMATFSFQGVELVGVAAGEVKDAQTNVVKAAKQVFWRIIIFYLLTIFIIASLINYADPRLLSTEVNSIAQSPFAIVLSAAGLSHVASFMNFVILIAVLSAANSDLYSSSRILYSMSEANEAPKFIAHVNQKKVPIVSVLITAVFALGFYVLSHIGSGSIFLWLINLSTLSGVIAWSAIIISHFGFRKYLLQENIAFSSLSFYARFYPYGQIYSLFGCVLVILGQVLVLMNEEQLSILSVLSAYAIIPLLLLVFLYNKYYRRGRL